ncbi:MAG TPA: hypothetical protein VGS41_06845 [Chthonomonadales bacterium]|nr:hypothetical protein [Chthonomonadales bacterium]
MSHVVSMRLQDEQFVRLKRYARMLGKTSGEVSAMLIEEQLRSNEFAFIEFRSSPAGRHAYMKGSRLTVWWVIHVANNCSMSAEQIAANFRRSLAWARAALNYYKAYPSEIDLAIAENESADLDTLKRALPNTQVLEVAREMLT